MNQDREFSDEVINAYVDGELEKPECREILASASRSPDLSRRICETAYLKLLVRSAWKEPAVKSAHKLMKRSPLVSYALAAGLGALSLLVVMTAGDLVHAPAELTASQSLAREQPASLNPATQSRVVFHVSSADPTMAEELLDQVQLILQDYASQGRSLKVEVVANNQGIELLQKGISPVADRIQELNARYNNLRFAACGNTLERLSREQGETIVVLPEATVIESGVSFVTRRQQEGWVYIKV
jgi:intracellular sulfur oxidation DsrE/DsrF family protein